ncbi:MAG: hypothetical protein NZ903_00280 [Candidatus Micrarchaeota archaeon]|nr:hypothetical protein [Candidatus Micrarchaeota archaeon]
MTRSFIKNICAWFKSAFWDKIFAKKPQKYHQKRETPKQYYKGKEMQQFSSLKKKARL